MRRIIVIAMVMIITSIFAALAQEAEPMANPDCTAENLADPAAQLDQYYADAQTALADGDVRAWLENLRVISWLSIGLRAYCDGYVFEGDGEGHESQVLGPLVFQPGVYVVTVTTPGRLLVHIEHLSDSCGTLTIGVSEGEATEGAQGVFRVEDDPCSALLEISNITDTYRVEFSRVGDG